MVMNKICLGLPFIHMKMFIVKLIHKVTQSSIQARLKILWTGRKMSLPENSKLKVPKEEPKSKCWNDLKLYFMCWIFHNLNLKCQKSFEQVPNLKWENLDFFSNFRSETIDIRQTVSRWYEEAEEEVSRSVTYYNWLIKLKWSINNSQLYKNLNAWKNFQRLVTGSFCFRRSRICTKSSH